MRGLGTRGAPTHAILPGQFGGVVTALEAYELTTQGGSTDFARLIRTCESFGSYCPIGGLAVNCYVEPVYTLDAGIVLILAGLPGLAVRLEEDGFKTEAHAHSLNALAPGSELRIQFTTDERYQAFPLDARRPRFWGYV